MDVRLLGIPLQEIDKMWIEAIDGGQYTMCISCNHLVCRCQYRDWITGELCKWIKGYE